MNIRFLTKPITFAILNLLCFASHAQIITPFASGFVSPAGITRDAGNNLWVCEPGTGFNNSRVSMVNSSGTVYPVIENLPSHFDTVTFEVSGAWRAFKDGNELFVVIGEGPDSNAGSVLTFDLSGFTPGDQPINGSSFSNALHIDDYLLANGFDESNPYSIAWDTNGDLLICDAAANAVLKYDGSQFSVEATFAPIENIYTPFPPFIDYVPTRIINKPGGGFYLCNLTGFPFVPGLAKLISLDESGNITTVADGLSLTVDLDVDPLSGDVYALQFGVFDTTFSPVFNSARIIRVSAAGDTSTVIGGFGPSAGMVLDENGGAYVTTLFTGEVLHISDILSSVNDMNNTNEINPEVFPNPFNTTASVAFHLAEPSEVRITIFNVMAQPVYELEEFFMGGNHTISFNGKSVSGKDLAAGMYMVQVEAGEFVSSIPMIKN